VLSDQKLAKHFVFVNISEQTDEGENESNDFQD